MAVLILGIGNVLWADEGFGIRAVEALLARGRLPAGVEVIDGGTQGLYLLPLVQEAERLIVLDAVDFGLVPGTMVTLRDAEVPRLMGAKRLSLHQTTFQDVLAAAELLGSAPAAIALVGIQAGTLDDFGSGLTPSVAARLPDALAEVDRVLLEWGYGADP
jgi:hydrogenase maturation protease